MEKRGTLRADCVGSFIISHGDFRKFIDVMQEQLNKYEKRTEETKESVLPSS
jgi:hemerythrin-like domain-containing protein